MSRRLVGTGRVPQVSRLEHVLLVGWRRNPNALPIDATMQDLLDAGLSRYLVDLIMQSTDPNTFLAAVDAFLTREQIDLQQAKSAWNAAGMRFFDTPPGYVESREAFVGVLGARDLVLPHGWSKLASPLNVYDIATFARRAMNGEHYFWVFDDAALFSTCLIAASLEVETVRGKAFRLKLRMQLAEAIKYLAGAYTAVHLNQLAEALERSLFSENLDPLLASIVRNLGTNNNPLTFPDHYPFFEEALAAADANPEWMRFVARYLGSDSEFSLRMFYGFII